VNTISNTIITPDFLLTNESAKVLYHDFAANLPIIDYHNHLSPSDIEHNRHFTNLTDIWLKGDHYKWRAMRGLGVNENLISGHQTSDEDKFLAWSSVFPKMIRNPLFHWSQMELKSAFGIDMYLNEHTAKAIYAQANVLLKTDALSTCGILKLYNVELVGTTDDPCDNLLSHKNIADTDLTSKVVPTFRPDKIFNLTEKNDFLRYLKDLEKLTNVHIDSISNLLWALEKRINYFHELGCRSADHGLVQMPSKITFTPALETEFITYLNSDNKNTFSDPERFTGVVLLALCRIYHKLGWVQQFHLGPIRNNNTRLFILLGRDAGTDSIGDFPQAFNLANFLNALDQRDQLAKTILYNINPADNDLFATMCGNFNDGSMSGKIQYGSGWWFLDQKSGIEQQLNSLSNMGTISNFIGMTTDSRSFLSFPRHDYFRRILCNLFGTEMESGLIPSDVKWIGDIVQNICYHNAKNYFKF
jgi:glucuronate isomerase